MIGKAQPWFHSWYGDLLGLHLVPLIAVLLAFFDLPPFNIYLRDWTEVIVWIIVLDWAHIFAQWHRIYCNPLETKMLKWIYPISFFLLVPCLTVVLHYSGRIPVETFLIYFVVYHFIKQNYGYIRVYSKTDGPKQKYEMWLETLLIYLSMALPVLYWHLSFPYDLFTWVKFFPKWGPINLFLTPLLILYILCWVSYLVMEVRRSLRNNQINIPKNLSILSAAVGWGAITLLSESPMLVYFTVVLAHDLSYTTFVWFIGRRDQKMISGKIPWRSWSSVPGFFMYLLAIVVVSQFVLLLHHRFAGSSYPNLVFGNYMEAVKVGNKWMTDLGFAIFFATQAHHYFIDRYLWKKEKDLEYMVKTGKHSLS